MPVPHHWFLQAGCPFCRPTNSVKAQPPYLKMSVNKKLQYFYLFMYSRVIQGCRISITELFLAADLCSSSRKSAYNLTAWLNCLISYPADLFLYVTWLA